MTEKVPPIRREPGVRKVGIPYMRLQLSTQLFQVPKDLRTKVSLCRQSKTKETSISSLQMRTKLTRGVQQRFQLRSPSIKGRSHSANSLNSIITHPSRPSAIHTPLRIRVVSKGNWIRLKTRSIRRSQIYAHPCKA